MEVYVFGYNLDGQISCNVDDITHMHSDIYDPVHVDLSRVSRLESSTSQPEAEAEYQSTLDNDLDSHTTDSFAKDTLQVISSWNQLFCVKDGRVLIKGYHEDKTCQEIVLPLHQIMDISSGWDTTTLIDKTGHCYLWRRRACDQDPVTVKTEEGVHFLQVSVGGRSVAAVTVSGNVGYIEEREKDVFLFCPMLNTMKVKEVSCGKEHTLILSRIGQVFSLGLGSRGQLGHGDTQRHDEARVVEALEGVTMTTVAAGGWHSATISDIGDLYVWGWNESGQLGLPCKHAHSQSDNMKPSTGGGHHKDTQEPVNILTLPHLLEVDDLDPNTEGQREEVTHVKVSCGSRHTASITECGRVYTWGWNSHGQLGHGDALTRDTPTQVCYFSTHRLKVVSVAAGYWNTAVIVDTR